MLPGYFSLVPRLPQQGYTANSFCKSFRLCSCGALINFNLRELQKLHLYKDLPRQGKGIGFLISLVCFKNWNFSQTIFQKMPRNPRVIQENSHDPGHPVSQISQYTSTAVQSGIFADVMVSARIAESVYRVHSLLVSVLDTARGGHQTLSQQIHKQ